MQAAGALPLLECPVADLPQPINKKYPDPCVARLLRSDTHTRAGAFDVFKPVQDEQGAPDPFQLARYDREAVRTRVPAQSNEVLAQILQ